MPGTRCQQAREAAILRGAEERVEGRARGPPQSGDGHSAHAQGVISRLWEKAGCVSTQGLRAGRASSPLQGDPPREQTACTWLQPKRQKPGQLNRSVQEIREKKPPVYKEQGTEAFAEPKAIFPGGREDSGL